MDLEVSIIIVSGELGLDGPCNLQSHQPCTDPFALCSLYRPASSLCSKYPLVDVSTSVIYPDLLLVQMSPVLQGYAMSIHPGIDFLKYYGHNDLLLPAPFCLLLVYTT